MKNFLKAIGELLLYIVLFFGAIIIAALTYTALVMNGVVADTDTTLEIAVVLSLLLAAFLIWLSFRIRKKKFLTEIHLVPVAKRVLLWMLLLGLGKQMLFSVTYSYIPWPESWEEEYSKESEEAGDYRELKDWISAVVIAPVVEEVVFRGLLYTRLKKGMPVILAAFLSSLIFGVLHGSPIWAITVGIFSLLYPFVFERFQSLLPCIVLHFATNFSGMVLDMPLTDAQYWALAVIGIAGGVYSLYQIFREGLRKGDLYEQKCVD